jgi:hypothetical protein
MQNLLLAEIFSPFFILGPGLPHEIIWKWSGTTCTSKAMPWSKALGAFKREDASWRHMLVKQPPVQTLIIETMCYGQHGSSHREAVVTDLSLQMGDLYNLAVPISDCFLWGTFCVLWPGNVEGESELMADSALVA